MLDARNITVTSAAGKALIADVSISVRPGEIVALVGPNGAGKTTLLKAMAGELTPRRGQMTMNDRALGRWTIGAMARTRAVLPQESSLTFPFTVAEVVRLGYGADGERSAAADAGVQTSMQLAEVDHLRDRIYTTLSGGERQRVHLARVLAQIGTGRTDDNRPRYLLLDEPTASLDIAHQHAILATVRRLASEGVGCLAILHDLNLAAMYGDRIAVMAHGRLTACGKPDDVLQSKAIDEAFAISLRVERHPTHDCPLVIALPAPRKTRSTPADQEDGKSKWKT